MYRAGFHNHTAPGMLIRGTAAATGIASGYLGPVPAGYCWYVERMTAHSNTALTSGCVLEIFVLSEPNLPSNYTATTGSRMGRQDVSTNPQNDVSDENSPIYVPEGYYVVAGWTGFTSGNAMSVSLQVAVHQLTLPQYGQTAETIAAEHLWAHQGDLDQSHATGPHQ